MTELVNCTQEAVEIYLKIFNLGFWEKSCARNQSTTVHRSFFKDLVLMDVYE
jgi:hypothetical protein